MQPHIGPSNPCPSPLFPFSPSPPLEVSPSAVLQQNEVILTNQKGVQSLAAHISAEAKINMY